MADIARMPMDVLEATRELLSRMDERVKPAFMGWFEEGTLPVDIYEQDGSLILEASPPGIARDAIDIQLHQGEISITATPPTPEQSGSYYRRERPQSPVSRRIALPGILHDAGPAAELVNGVLRVTVPVPERAKPKHVDIKG